MPFLKSAHIDIRIQNDGSAKGCNAFVVKLRTGIKMFVGWRDNELYDVTMNHINEWAWNVADNRLWATSIGKKCNVYPKFWSVT